MNTILKKTLAMVLALSLVGGLLVCPSMAADSSIAEKSLKYFDEAESQWNSVTITAGSNYTYKMPDGISGFQVNNGDTARVSRVEKDGEDAALKLHASRYGKQRFIFANVFEAAGAASWPVNTSANDKFTVYMDLKTDSIPAEFKGDTVGIINVRLFGAKTTAGTNNYIDIVGFANDADGKSSIYDFGGKTFKPYTLGEWVNVAIEVTYSGTKAQCVTYINGAKAFTSASKDMTGLSYIRAGYQQNNATTATTPNLYIDNVAFYKGGFSSDRYKAIETASALSAADIKGANASLDSLTGNLTLPTIGSDGTAISWQSSHPHLIGTDGKMTPSGTEATKVTLTATAKSGDMSEKKVYTATVPYSEDGYVYAEAVESKAFDSFDSTPWVIDESVTAGYTQSLDYPKSMSLYWNNLQVSKADKATGALGKDDADASLHLYTNGNVSGSREFGANLFAASDAALATKNISAGDKFTTYVDLAADQIPENMGYFGMRVLGRKSSAEATNQFTEIFNFVNNGNETYSIKVGSASVPYTLGSWVQIAIETEFVTKSQIQSKVYVDGTLLGTTAQTQLSGISYVRVGFQKGTSVSSDASMYVDNVAFRAHQGYNSDFGKVIADFASITEASIKGSNPSLTAVSSNLSLSTTGAKGSHIEWTSSNRGVVSNAGVVTPSYLREITVMLNATITSGEESVPKSFAVTVPKAEIGGEEDSSFFKDGFKNNTCKFEKSISSSLQSFTAAHADGVYLIYNNKLYADYSGLGSSTASGKPYVIYKTDEVIAGFEIDTLFYNHNGKYCGDFSFMLSADGERWIDASDYVTISNKALGYDEASGYAKCTYTGELDEYTNYYLKITWGSAGEVGKRYRSSIDTVSIFYPDEVQLASRDFTFDRISAESIDDVQNNLDLTAVGDYGTTISWASDNEDVISSSTGRVNASAFDGYSCQVALTATFAKPGLESKTKTFDVTVCKDVSAWSDMDYVEYDLANLTFASFCNQPQSQLVGKVRLPSGVDGGSRFSWRVANEKSETLAITDNVVDFVPETYKAADWTLFVTASKGSAQKTKLFPVTVMRGYGDNLAASGKLTASSAPAAIRNTQDRALVSYWQTEAGDTQKKINISFTKNISLGAALLVEKGNNITGYTIKVSEDNFLWQTVYTGTTLGDMVRQPVTFPSVSCKYVEIAFTSDNPVALYSAELYTGILSPAQQVAKSLEAISIPTITSTNLSLPTEGEYGGVISWRSADESIITKTGVVSRKSGADRTTTLWATVTLGDARSEERAFSVTVTGSIASSGSSGSSGGSSGMGAALPFAGAETPQAGGIFKDVPLSHWAHSHIHALKDAGIVSVAEYFRPDDKITREEFLKMLINSIGIDAASAPECSFDDVSASAWYYPYVCAGVEAGITNGMGNGAFGIGQPIKRQDLAVMIHRAISENILVDTSSDLTFADGASISDYAALAVKYLTELRIINGYEDNSFRPFGNTTRAECAKIIGVLTSLLGKGAN